MMDTPKKRRTRKRLTPEQKQRREERFAKELAASQAAYRTANHTALYGVAPGEPLPKKPEPISLAGRKQLLKLQIQLMQAEYASL
jgi:hypothetical protein